MDPAWREHVEALKRFNAWEDAQLRGLREDYSDALAWMAEAWDLARRMNPAGWGPAATRDEHAEHLVRLQNALAKARLSP
jgi:hypothetical protein